MNWDPSRAFICEPLSANASSPPQLKSICLHIVAQNARALTRETLCGFSCKILHCVWFAITQQGRDSLETWLMFCEAANNLDPLNNFACHFPNYLCWITPHGLTNLHSQLNGTLKCDYPSSLNECVIADGDIKLNSRLVVTLSGFRNLRHLDLRRARWPLEVTEARHFLSMLVKSLSRGGLTTVVCLRLPKRGPQFLKESLRMVWPATLRLIQTPVKPADYRSRWSACTTTPLDAQAVQSITVQYQILPGRTVDEYVKGCFRRR